MTDQSESVLEQRPRWKRWFPWAGRHYDTLPELAMNAGVWMGFFGVGIIFGMARPDPRPFIVGAFALAVLLGIPGQIAVEWSEYNDER